MSEDSVITTLEEWSHLQEQNNNREFILYTMYTPSLSVSPSHSPFFPVTISLCLPSLHYLAEIFLESLKVIDKFWRRWSEVWETVLTHVASCFNIIQSKIMNLMYNKGIWTLSLLCVCVCVSNMCLSICLSVGGITVYVCVCDNKPKNTCK